MYTYKKELKVWNYTAQRISNLVREKYPNGSSDVVIQEILENKILFKVKHYKKVSQILGVTIDELCSDTTEEVKFNFDVKPYKEMEDFLDKTLYLFNEWINQERLAKGI